MTTAAVEYHGRQADHAKAQHRRPEDSVRPVAGIGGQGGAGALGTGAWLGVEGVLCSTTLTSAVAPLAGMVKLHVPSPLSFTSTGLPFASCTVTLSTS